MAEETNETPDPVAMSPEQRATFIKESVAKYQNENKLLEVQLTYYKLQADIEAEEARRLNAVAQQFAIKGSIREMQKMQVAPVAPLTDNPDGDSNENSDESLPKQEERKRTLKNEKKA